MKTELYNKVNIQLSKIALIIIGLLFIFLILNNMLMEEKFSNYLYPIKGIQKECEKEGLKPAYMPMSCFKSNKDHNPYANCKCVDSSGMCKVCYPEITKYKKGSKTLFNPDDQNQDQ